MKNVPVAVRVRMAILSRFHPLVEPGTSRQLPWDSILPLATHWCLGRVPPFDPHGACSAATACDGGSVPCHPLRQRWLAGSSVSGACGSEYGPRPFRRGRKSTGELVPTEEHCAAALPVVRASTKSDVGRLLRHQLVNLSLRIRGEVPRFPAVDRKAGGTCFRRLPIPRAVHASSLAPPLPPAVRPGR